MYIVAGVLISGLIGALSPWLMTDPMYWLVIMPVVFVIGTFAGMAQAR